MILISNSTPQTLAPGQSITFDKVLLKSGDGECCHNNAARTLTISKIRRGGIYEISFSANIAVTTAAEGELSIQVDGVTLPETTALFLPAVADTEFQAIGGRTAVFNRCNESTPVTVTNTGTSTIIVDAEASLLIHRVSGGGN